MVLTSSQTTPLQDQHDKVSAKSSLQTPCFDAEATAPDIARAYVKRIDFCHTPKHGSWLGLLDEYHAECELSCLTSQCLTGRRIGELEKLQSEILTWSEKTNAKQRGVDWQFQITDARTKLKRLYPVIKTG